MARRPGTWNDSALERSSIGFVSDSLSTSTMPIDAPSCRFSTAPPVPVATTVSSSTALWLSVSVTVTESFAGTRTDCVAGRNPSRCARTVDRADGNASNEKMSTPIGGPAELRADDLDRARLERLARRLFEHDADDRSGLRAAHGLSSECCGGTREYDECAAQSE